MPAAAVGPLGKPEKEAGRFALTEEMARLKNEYFASGGLT